MHGTARIQALRPCHPPAAAALTGPPGGMAAVPASRCCPREPPATPGSGRPAPPGAPASRPATAPRRPCARGSVPDRPVDADLRVVPARCPIRRAACTCPSSGTRCPRAPRGRRTPARRRRAPRAAGRFSSLATMDSWRPSVGEPGRMSTATMKASPRATRMSLPIGGSHWKCRPRTTPRTLRLWLSCTKRLGRPSVGVLREVVGAEDLHEEAALVLERLGLHDEHLRDARAADLHLHGARSCVRWAPAPSGHAGDWPPEDSWAKRSILVPAGT